MSDQHKIVTDEIIKLLKGGTAHASFDDAVANMPEDYLGVKPEKLPYSIWQLAEHIRIAQWDMLQFCKDGNHQSPKWPDDYWPKEAAPADKAAWKNSLKQIGDDLDEFIKLLKKEDIYKPIPHGDGQTILLEALQMADHSAYHTGEIIAVRKVLGIWK